MGKLTNAALAQAPIQVRRQIASDPTDSVPTKVIRSKPAPPRESFTAKPSKYTYALKSYTIERRSNGWYICRTPFSSAGEKPEWSGAFETIETAALAIARRLATEAADRHTRSIEWHTIKPDDALYGLKPTTRLCRKKSAAAS